MRRRPGRPRVVAEGRRVDVLMPRDEYLHLNMLAKAFGMTIPAVLRLFVTTSLQKAEGTYDPLPSPEAMAEAFARVNQEMEAHRG